jgi:hypothetical protein
MSMLTRLQINGYEIEFDREVTAARRSPHPVILRWHES